MKLTRWPAPATELVHEVNGVAARRQLVLDTQPAELVKLLCGNDELLVILKSREFVAALV